jgi:4-hydroxy-tetrahydrodipicolinate synthase
VVAESVACPVILYNNPSTCGGLNIEPDTVGRLANVPNIVAIKDSSGDLQNTIEILRRTDHQSFSVLMGRDTLILSGLQNGIHGAIPATCNIAPHFCVGIYDSFRSGNLEAARKFQGDLHPIRLAMSLGTGNAAVKESLALLGQSCGPNRMPVTPFSHEKRDHLKSILKTAGLLPKGAH